MPRSIETDCQYQKALLWTPLGLNDQGEQTYNASIELKVRWQTVNSQVRQPNGQNIAVVARVVVDRVIESGSLMWLGGTRDLPGTADWPESGQCEVVDYQETPDLLNRYTRRTVTLMKFRGTEPSVT